MSATKTLYERQLWAQTTTTSSTKHRCTTLTLPSNAVLILDSLHTITLAQDAVYEPDCTADSSNIVHEICGNAIVTTRDPFYASVSPQIYALAIATAISYVLVIMLFITPRTFFVGGPGGGTGFLPRTGLVGGSHGHSAIIGVGRRPWLQKVAAMSAAVSLTIATADTFKAAESQYNAGYSDSAGVLDEVTESLEIRTVQVISDTFLYLAQVQTLIRLFPRHKEKVVIKWFGFALILLDSIFSILNNFVYKTKRERPRSFKDAIPALSYLFELAIGLIYASCVIYFSISKRRFAFFHPKMRNILIVAVMSIVSILIPVVFFILDVSQPNLAGWADYFRWVGAAAASVVVWEWVERIEALEREERKDGILGREVFDGDEMFENTSSQERDRRGSGLGGDGSEGKTSGSSMARRLRSRMPFRAQSEIPGSALLHPPPVASPLDHSEEHRPTPPPAGITPISRADTTSATSTQYAIHYHSVTNPSPPPPRGSGNSSTDDSGPSATQPRSTSISDSFDAEKPNNEVVEQDKGQPWVRFGQNLIRSMPNPFKRQKTSTPVEVAGALRQQCEETPQTSATSENRVGWPVFARVDAFATAQKRRLMSYFQEGSADTILPVTIIPAQPRGRTWSPQDFNESGTRSSIPPEQVPLSTASSRPITVTDGPASHRGSEQENVSANHLGITSMEMTTAGEVTPFQPNTSSEQHNDISSECRVRRSSAEGRTAQRTPDSNQAQTSVVGLHDHAAE